ncbi:hypothetical protein C8R46DRAFT_1030601 [Mycena filopes]|nr:hypothetical protein C8R46DRAFT_1030601 [Mycena filopes]
MLWLLLPHPTVAAHVTATRELPEVLQRRTYAVPSQSRSNKVTKEGTRLGEEGDVSVGGRGHGSDASAKVKRGGIWCSQHGTRWVSVGDAEVGVNLAGKHGNVRATMRVREGYHKAQHQGTRGEGRTHKRNDAVMERGLQMLLTGTTRGRPDLQDLTQTPSRPARRRCDTAVACERGYMLEVRLIWLQKLSVQTVLRMLQTTRLLPIRGSPIHVGYRRVANKFKRRSERIGLRVGNPALKGLPLAGHRGSERRIRPRSRPISGDHETSWIEVVRLIVEYNCPSDFGGMMGSLAEYQNAKRCRENAPECQDSPNFAVSVVDVVLRSGIPAL